MKLSLVKKIVVASLFTMISLSAFSVNLYPPYVIYVSVNPLTNDITMVWDKSKELVIDSLGLYYVSPQGNENVTIFKTYTQNVPGSYTINCSKIPTLGTTTVTAPLSFVAEVYVGANGKGNWGDAIPIAHTTIFASSSFQICPSRNVISWTAYKGFQLDEKTALAITKYNIYQYVGGTSILVGSVAGNVLTYSVPANQGAGQFFYYVEAEFNDLKGNPEKSTSNMTTATVVLPKYPTYLTGLYSQAVTDDSLKLSFAIDITSDITHFQLYKADTMPGIFHPQSGNIPIAAKSLVVFYDSTKGVSLHHNYYKLYAIDACNDTVEASNIVSTIVSTIQNSNNTNIINWNNFINWPNGVDHYDIYRAIDGETPYVLYSESKAAISSLTYTDNLSGVSGSGSEQCYFIEANSEPSKINNNISISNKVCVKQEDKLFIPDVCNPVSKIIANRSFKPIVAYINKSTYQFIVYNRLSEPIFKTTDPDNAWDGTVKGETVQEGTYIYFVSYKNSAGKSIEKRGTFYVIYNEN